MEPIGSRVEPDYESPYEAAASSLDALIAWTLENDFDRTRNEDTTRLHLIDNLLIECLKWPREKIVTEHPHGGTFADYLLGRGPTRLVVEAKKEGVYFELPVDFDSRVAKLKTLRDIAEPIGAAIDQAMGYCQSRAIPLGVVTNGHQLIAFIGSRQDGTPPAEGRALVFSSLEDMRAGFLDLWNSLSPPGVDRRHLYARLQGRTQPPPPEKLSARIVGYPGEKNRNQLATELKILGDLFLEDIAHAPEVEAEFLRETYCTSGALSQFALVSKEILQTRYDAFFANAGDLTPSPVANKKGAATQELTADAVAASMSRRPIILLGDVGVGKTMFIKHLIAVDAAEIFERALVLLVDFGSEPALTDEIESYVRRAFVLQLREEYDLDIHERDFVRAVYHGELNRFAKGIYGDLRETDPIEYKKHELSFLEDKLADEDGHLKASLEHAVGSQRRQIVIFLDNVDQRPFGFQERVFLIAQSIAQRWPGTVFVSLRPETFHKSRSTGSIAAYQPRVFTVSPPRVDLVLRRRLEFARLQLNKTGTLAGLGTAVTFESSALSAYIDALILSLKKNRELTELIDNLSGGNVRRALGFLTEFVGSGHVDSTKIVRIQEAQSGGYTVPVHEFLRAIIYGDAEHFDPSTVPIANLFDISIPDEREHFLVPILVSFIERAGDIGDQEGFVGASDVFDEGQRIGYAASQIDAALRRSLDAGLIESNLRGLSEGERDRFRITTIGAYSIKRLITLFTYVDAMVVDTPILDPKASELLVDARLVEERLARADAFRRYLDRAWVSLADAESAFDWPPASRELEIDIEQIAYRTSEG